MYRDITFLGDTYANGDVSTSTELARALELVDTACPIPLPDYRYTRERCLSRRGVIWLGQTCNLRCQFCYFITRIATKDHPEHAFMPLDKAKKICRTLVEVYGNSSVDIEGGEPTLYPHIFELIAYCVAIGLHPTLITNAVTLDKRDRCRRFKEAGIRDFKVSIHGLGEVHDKLVGCHGAHERQMVALRNMRELGIPFRFNVVLTHAVIPQLPEIARLAVASGALCVNWLGYNPHEDQEGQTQQRVLIPNFTSMRGALTEALDILEEAGIESNVRYVPPCMVEPRHRKSIYHFQQLFYDHREWDLASWSWTTLQPQRETHGEPSAPIHLSSLAWWTRVGEFLRILSNIPFLNKLASIKRLVNVSFLLPLLYKLQARIPAVRYPDEAVKAALYNRVAQLHARVDCNSIYSKECRNCKAKPICSGLYKEYVEVFGDKEVRPIAAETQITDPRYYICSQDKIVEKEDEPWMTS